MTDYNRTVWKDHIKDQYDNVIQQGVPASAKNLNNIENQLVILSAKENTLSELVKENIPSGFTSLSDLDYTYMSTNPNAIKLLSDSTAFVNGYKVVIPAGTVIQLDAPPVSGSRDDLVFLECWKQTDVNGSVTWNWRLRVVSGVDFTFFPSDGLTSSTGYGWDPSGTYPTRVQGANSAPIPMQTTSAQLKYITGFIQSGSAPDIYFKGNDRGLYVSGDGSSASKTILGTTDGYVYAIPMFRVHRRNSGGYSVTNGNGSINNFRPWFSMRSGTYYNFDSVGTWTLGSVTDYDKISVGDIFINGTTDKMQIVSKDGNNKVSVKFLKIAGTFPATLSTSTTSYVKDMVRCDQLLSDIIVDRDIIDLRHQVSLTGFNYQQLLEENFDKLLRGELQTNAKTTMVKHYHGIPKTPIDSNHVFYASLDGTTVAEVGGGSVGLSNASFDVTPTGLGIKVLKDGKISLNTIPTSIYTFDITIGKIDVSQVSRVIFDLQNSSSSRVLRGYTTGSAFNVTAYSDSQEIKQVVQISPVMLKPFNHLRCVVTATSIVVYLNGTLLSSYTSLSGISVSPKYFIPGSTGADLVNPINVVSDVSISNIDRGAVFATLPQDFIDSYARISPAFNEQRNVFSDALTSETDFVQVKATGGNGKAISTTQGTTGAWASGDKVKVKGLGGEIITGVIDADTALCRILSGNGQTLSIEDVSKIAVNDVLMPYNTITRATGTAVTVTAIDTTNKIITFTGDPIVQSSVDNGWNLLIETTASSSAPVVKYLNGATLTDVTGTWSGLGTNEATFTLGTNASLTTQDLYVTYSLNEVAGQGGISEVLTATLAGESNGKKLTVNPTVHVRDDFASKVKNDTVACPNISKYMSSSSLLVPSSASFSEFEQLAYDRINKLDNTSQPTIASTNGAIPQQLLSFSLIRILEDKFGPLPCGSDLASKIAYAKANVSKITFNWWGCGSCPSGNKATIGVYNNSNGYDGLKGHSLNTVSLMSISLSSGYYIDSNGFIHFLAYTDASDGTIASTIFTDYANIEITLNTPTGYDVLGPENPRRDDGKANILLVRKETKEIQSMFSRSNTDGVLTYGDYVQNNVYGATEGVALTEPIGVITTLGTGRYYPKTVYSSYSKYIQNWLPKDALAGLLCDNVILNKNDNIGGSSWSTDGFLITKIKILRNSTYNGGAGLLKFGYGLADLGIGQNISTTNYGFSILDANIDLSVPHVKGVYQLVKVNNELLLRVILEFNNGSGMKNFFQILGAKTFRLYNRPLIK